VKRQVEAMGWDISVKSFEGRGAIFRLDGIAIAEGALDS
jgi:signal transduction histidine kinase